jgi:hypothetical protein
MTEFEDRLRAAMASANSPAPAGLLDAIRKRRRQHRRRVTATVAGVTAMAALGAPLAVQLASSATAPGSHAAPAARTGPVPGSGLGGLHLTSPPPTAAPGTVLRACNSAEGGTLGSDWKAQSVQAGPVWFISAKPPAGAQVSHELKRGTLDASAMAIAVSNGHTAIITAGPATHARFRFLASFHSGNAPYTMTDGAPGLTLSGCPSGPIGTGIPESYAPGLTIFWEGYVTDLRGCIPVEVRTTPHGTPVRVTIAAPGCVK